MQPRTDDVPAGGLRFRLVALGLALVGGAFIAVALWAFLLPAIADMRAGRVTLFTATRAGITWSHVYAVSNHPVDFAVGVLTEILGAIGFGGMGMFVSFGCLLRAFGPTDIKFGARGRRMAAAWVYGNIATIALYFLLWPFPYLLRYGVLS